MSDKAARVVTAIVVYALATALSVAVFHGRSAGLLIDGVLLLGLFYYLSTIRN